MTKAKAAVTSVPSARPFKRWRAFYENAEKVEAAAKERGFTGNDGESWHDFVEAESNRFRTERLFYDLDAAVEWLKLEMAATRSVYGCGEVIAEETPERRCRYCACHGWIATRRYIVSDTGIEEDTALDPECCD